MVTNPPNVMPSLRWIVLIVASLLFGFGSQSVRAQISDDTLLAYAANIQLSSPQGTWSGYGIYLGKGLFITAAHVVGRAWMTRPKVVIAGQGYPTSVVKEGSFEGTDLTLLAI